MKAVLAPFLTCNANADVLTVLLLQARGYLMFLLVLKVSTDVKCMMKNGLAFPPGHPMRPKPKAALRVE